MTCVKDVIFFIPILSRFVFEKELDTHNSAVSIMKGPGLYTQDQTVRQRSHLILVLVALLEICVNSCTRT